jgi:hypothetical protein
MEPGTEAAELVCEGLPAGGIFGRVLLRDGEPARDYSIDVLPVQKPEGLPAHGNLGNSSDWEGPDGRYNAAPLPLGGTYVVVLTRSRYTRLLSGPIALTPESPFHELDLQFPEGVAVRGQVLLPDGSPARGAPVTLRYRNAEYADGTNYQAGATDGSGLFRLDGVNPDAGSYTIEIGSNHSWQPYQGPARLDGRPMEVRLKKGLTVSGKVIDDASGLPIPGAKVMAGRSAVDAPPPLWREAEGPTDEAGAFRFSNLARGEYFLDVYGTTRAHGIAPVITAGQKDPVEVRVTIPAWSRLRPAPPGDATP